MRQIKVKIKGLSPLLMHSDKFANPLDPATKAHKELTGKRKKTDDDHEAIAKSEWMGGLYTDDNGPAMPTQNLKGSLVQAAKLQKLGANFKRALMILEDMAPLKYSGPRDPEAMWKDKRFVDARSVVVTTSRLMRYRPKFKEWSFEATIVYDETMINDDDVVLVLRNAGNFIGLCDYRPEKGGGMGRFEAEVV